MIFLNKATSSQTPAFGKFVLNCLVAALVGILLLLVLCGICALILNTVENPDGLYGVCGTVIYVISALVCGAVAKRKNGCSALFCGILSGGVLIALIFALSLVFVFVQPQAPLWQTAILPFGAVVGAVFGKQK